MKILRNSTDWQICSMFTMALSRSIAFNNQEEWGGLPVYPTSQLIPCKYQEDILHLGLEGLGGQLNKVTWQQQLTTISPRCPPKHGPLFHSSKTTLRWQCRAGQLRLCDKILDTFSLTSAARLKASDLGLSQGRGGQLQTTSWPPVTWTSAVQQLRTTNT